MSERSLVNDIDQARSVNAFAPKRIQAVTADTEWTPGEQDLAFCVSADCTYKINDTGSSGTLFAGAVRVIQVGLSYTFDTTMNIEVM